MIFEEEMMCMDTEQFLIIILKAKHMYKRHANADMDDDDSKEN